MNTTTDQPPQSVAAERESVRSSDWLGEPKRTGDSLTETWWQVDAYYEPWRMWMQEGSRYKTEEDGRAWLDHWTESYRAAGIKLRLVEVVERRTIVGERVTGSPSKK